ncbi:translesion error-prone DNA polymerase V autoproteolytic subunit [Faecalibacter sp. LW9]|uniref:LexA family protein n=1 Tax=Faecalibacter sp. LW9 TaxID=3103144 RepID=UPI002AFFCBDA|nr:translesion error-prone DNA polymerase V autoproteolytic subunit [Faecalibacter sp. LW9]
MKLIINSPQIVKGREAILMENPIQAGFPSPAEDFKTDKISLDVALVKNRESTFYARVKGDSMIDADMDEGDILVIDKSLEPANGKIAVCMVDGEFTVKRIKVDRDCLWLIPYNKKFSPIRITEDNDFMVWGIVTYIIKHV